MTPKNNIAKGSRFPSKRPFRRTSRKKSIHFSLKRFFNISLSVALGFFLVSGLYIYTSYHLLVEPLNLRWKAHYSTPIYPKGYNIRGIDVSHYQGEIDWQKVRNSSINSDPILFVVIKATEGESMIDENFNENFYEAQQNDLHLSL